MGEQTKIMKTFHYRLPWDAQQFISLKQRSLNYDRCSGCQWQL